MEKHPRTPDPEQRPPIEREPAPGDPYILLEGGLVTNNPSLPIIDVEILLGGEVEEARAMAEDASRFGLHEIAERLRLFADIAQRSLAGVTPPGTSPDDHTPPGADDGETEGSDGAA